mmetsp:Transcript_20492/g.51786  ORF Transcript_20492/g.51786 Transcript_20492/m.51786 type:complete len:87 (-) Transcript_20492:607-867(-)
MVLLQLQVRLFSLLNSPQRAILSHDDWLDCGDFFTQKISIRALFVPNKCKSIVEKVDIIIWKQSTSSSLERKLPQKRKRRHLQTRT